MNWLTKTPIAHRGLYDSLHNIPENSLIAFESAVTLGFPIELDLQFLTDDEIAVFHDTYLSRMTGERGSILTKDKNQIKNYKLADSGQSIPLLKDVLDLVNGKVPLLLELKSRRSVGQFESILLKYMSGYKGEFAVESFNPLSVRWFRENAPHILRGQLYGGMRGRRFFTRLSNPHFGVFDIRFIPENVLALFRKRNLPVLGFTAKSKEEFESAMQILDNVIFEGFIPI